MQSKNLVRILAAAIVSVAVAQAAPSHACRQLFEDGKAARKAGSFQEAEAALTKVIACFEAPGSEFFLASAITEFAVTKEQQGNLTEAKPLAAHAVELFASGSPVAHSGLASAYNNLAAIEQQLGDRNSAKECYLHALENWKLAGSGEPGMLQTLSNLASLDTVNGEYREAEALLRQALAAAGQEQTPEKGSILNELGIVEDKLGRADAVPLLQEALAIRGTYAVESNLARALEGAGRFEEAEKLARHASTRCGTDCASVLSNIASIEEKTGRIPEAEADYRKTIALFSSPVLRDMNGLLAALNNLGRLYLADHHYRESQELLDRAYSYWTTLKLPKTIEKSSLLTNLGALSLEHKKWDRATELFEEALAIDQRILGPNHTRIATDLSNLAALAVRRKHYDKAQELFETALAMEETVSSKDSPAAARRIAILAQFNYLRKRYDRATDLYARAFTILGEHTGFDTATEVRMLNEYANCLRLKEDYADAARLSQRAMTEQVKKTIHGEQSMF